MNQKHIIWFSLTNTKKSNNVNIEIDHKKIEKCKTTLFLGVTIDSNLRNRGATRIYT